MSEKKFITCKINNVDKKFRIISTFFSSIRKKSYVIYTDDLLDEEKNLNIYASILNVGGTPVLMDIENDNDWEEVENFLKNMKENNNG